MKKELLISLFLICGCMIASASESSIPSFSFSVISVLDGGRKVTKAVGEGEKTITLETSALPGGIYSVVYSEGETIIDEKKVKLNK